MNNLYKKTAWLYDIDNRDNLSADIPFYLEYAKQQSGEILELGCGTGRVAMTLAKEGFKVTGIDLSNEMLEVFKNKIAVMPELDKKITLIHGSMVDFHIDRRFAMIISSFRAFQSLTDNGDIENSLKCIYEHLTHNGIFIINVFKPRSVLDESCCYTETVQWERLDEKTGNYVIKKHWGDKIDTENQVIYPKFAYEVTTQDGSKSRLSEDLSLKYYYENQLVELIEKTGFIIKEKFGWYDKSTIEQAQRELIFVCGRKE